MDGIFSFHEKDSFSPSVDESGADPDEFVRDVPLPRPELRLAKQTKNKKKHSLYCFLPKNRTRMVDAHENSFPFSSVSETAIGEKHTDLQVYMNFILHIQALTICVAFAIVAFTCFGFIVSLRL